jgi:hypothetical protein
MNLVGGFSFGLIIGYLAWHVARPGEPNTELNIKTLFGIIGALGGAVILTLFPAGTDLFSTYSIGLAIGFFLTSILQAIKNWLSVKSQEKKRKEREQRAKQEKEDRDTQAEFLFATEYIKENLDVIIRVVGQKFIDSPTRKLMSYELKEFPVGILTKIQMLRFFALSMPEMFDFEKVSGLTLHEKYTTKDISFLTDPAKVRAEIKYLVIP